ncbi:putative phosphohistidine phosphatase, SixA [Denitrovibrio acetiphilus DSM 12809]|uniref:Putative phosphohistidine phosphatase, SixA n=1 Tax=Denitrovibrio acetiphilus (strain DSM 12809 / NBRC 114555 / N2460) TaxID=522772 RepID=D4H743_DENA2|nr:histidine phosphatase family protein [Denitrovibrio acetiphilus]ADD69747.1 putative phosphohistidine phosphatase, SixA [Denitrovibrio acetiphilus DSM 12809]
MLYLIRHGHAEDRSVWHDSDLKRPLVNRGVTRARKAFSRFIKLYPSPDIIFCSEALRALQTAEILHKLCGAEIVVTRELNPGASPMDYQKILDDLADDICTAVVGHEPDMSEFMSHYLTGGNLNIVFKKGSIAHIEDKQLINLIQQKVLI